MGAFRDLILAYGAGRFRQVDQTAQQKALQLALNKSMGNLAKLIDANDETSERLAEAAFKTALEFGRLISSDDWPLILKGQGAVESRDQFRETTKWNKYAAAPGNTGDEKEAHVQNRAKEAYAKEFDQNPKTPRKSIVLKVTRILEREGFEISARTIERWVSNPAPTNRGRKPKAK